MKYVLQKTEILLCLEKKHRKENNKKNINECQSILENTVNLKSSATSKILI